MWKSKDECMMIVGNLEFGSWWEFWLFCFVWFCIVVDVECFYSNHFLGGIVKLVQRDCWTKWELCVLSCNFLCGFVEKDNTWYVG